jgi:hypothetical protein
MLGCISAKITKAIFDVAFFPVVLEPFVSQFTMCSLSALLSHTALTMGEEVGVYIVVHSFAAC